MEGRGDSPPINEKKTKTKINSSYAAAKQKQTPTDFTQNTTHTHKNETNEIRTSRIARQTSIYI